MPHFHREYRCPICKKLCRESFESNGHGGGGLTIRVMCECSFEMPEAKWDGSQGWRQL